MTAPSTFREVRLRDPINNVFAALAILQSHILASDSNTSREHMWGGEDYTGGAELELAVSLLVAVVAELERKEWTVPATA